MRSGVEDADVRFLAEDGWMSSTLVKVDAAMILSGWPVRSFPAFLVTATIAIAFNLTRAAATLAGPTLTKATTATIQRK
jgi:hypothetical protein